jgi:GNAT superfamily N-acetyltransferase
MKNNYLITKMQPGDIEILNNIMKRSVQLWRYPGDKMELILNRLVLTSEFMDKSVGYVAKLDNIIKGFFALVPMQEEGLNPAKFYIEPEKTRSGLGTLLWNQVITDLKSQKIKELKFDIDPSAQGFYEKLGAIKIAERPSTIIKEHMIPIMKYIIIEN